LKLTFTGTLEILLRAKVEGRIPRIRPVFEQLDQLKFRLSFKNESSGPQAGRRRRRMRTH
jgi:predicted nucleic acid-binding protein